MNEEIIIVDATITKDSKVAEEQKQIESIYRVEFLQHEFVKI
jgi:hypothetical protein